MNKPKSDEKSSTEEAKPKATLEERLSSGAAKLGPTVPSNQEQDQNNQSSPTIHQVYPPTSEGQQEDQSKQDQLQASQASQPEDQEQKQKAEGENKSEQAESTDASAPKQDEAQEKPKLTEDEEKKVVDSVLKQLTPLVEQLVAAEVRRILLGGQNNQDDENDFVPFPFMFASGAPAFVSSHGGPPPQGFPQQQANRVRLTKKI